MNSVEGALLAIVGLPLCAAAFIAVIAIGVFLVATAYAFVKPYIQHLIDAYVDWFERRIGL